MNAWLKRSLVVAVVLMVGLAMPGEVCRGDFLLSNLAGNNNAANSAFNITAEGGIDEYYGMASLFTVGTPTAFNRVSMKLSTPTGNAFNGTFSVGIYEIDDMSNPTGTPIEIASGFDVSGIDGFDDQAQVVDFNLGADVNLMTGTSYRLVLTADLGSTGALLWSIGDDPFLPIAGVTGWSAGQGFILSVAPSTWIPASDGDGIITESASFAFGKFDVSAVPEPSSIALLSIAAIAGAAVRRKKLVRAFFDCAISRK